MNTKFLLIGAAVVAALAFALGIIIGHFAINRSTTTYDRLTRQADQQNYKTFVNSIQATNIEADLKDLTSRPHMAGLPEDLESALVIEQRWKNDGLQVTKPKYNVLLSYPDDNNPNRVTLTSGNGTVIIQTNGTERVYDPLQPKTVNPFLAYTPNGTVASTKLYYANYGQLEDLEMLASIVGNASLQGSIIIMRYGRIFRGDKIMHAQYFGAVGAILYNDPADYAPFGTSSDQVYDQKWYMPPSGAQRGSTYTSQGDPLTPVYPSTAYMYRVQEENIRFLPKIPAQSIGYSEAKVIFQYLPGDEVNSTWRGALKVTYRYGGQFPDSSKIEVRSYNRRERKDTYNVIGIMKGDVEPDRYVVIGNHRYHLKSLQKSINDFEKCAISVVEPVFRNLSVDAKPYFTLRLCTSGRTHLDAWSLGAIDPTSGTVVLLEITRVLGQMYRNGFRPRRSLMFCSWGAEEYGLIGSVEYVQEYVKVLGARIVSYLNLDTAVDGNYTVNVRASPILFDAIVEAAKMVPSAYDPVGQTVYDKWMRVRLNTITNEPNIGYGLGSGSDYFGFDQLAGSSNMYAKYIFDSTDHGNLGSYPLYHTSYEVFSMMKKFVDPEFYAHRTMAQLTGVLALRLSETPVLPFNVSRYTSALIQAMNNLRPTDFLVFNPLRAAINDFGTAAQDFVTRSKSMDVENPYELRAYNDQLLQLERAFLNPLGQGGDYSDMKHIIYAPAKTNKYAASGFPSIGDAIAIGNSTEIEHQVAIVTYFIRGALSTLKEFNQFMTE